MGAAADRRRCDTADIHQLRHRGQRRHHRRAERGHIRRGSARRAPHTRSFLSLPSSALLFADPPPTHRQFSTSQEFVAGDRGLHRLRLRRTLRECRVCVLCSGGGAGGGVFVCGVCVRHTAFLPGPRRRTALRLRLAQGVVALLFPFPRTATPQLERRIALAYRQIAHLHVLLTVALLETKVPHILNEEIERLLGKSKLGQTMESMNLLFEEARWEPAMCWGNKNSELQWHVSLIHVLVRNVRLRYNRRRIDRYRIVKTHAALVERLTDADKNRVYYFAMKQAMEVLQMVSGAMRRDSADAMYLQVMRGTIDDFAEDIDDQVEGSGYKFLKKELQECLAHQDLDDGTVDPKLSLNLYESFWLTAEFNSKILNFVKVLCSRARVVERVVERVERVERVESLSALESH